MKVELYKNHSNIKPPLRPVLAPSLTFKSMTERDGCGTVTIISNKYSDWVLHGSTCR